MSLASSATLGATNVKRFVARVEITEKIPESLVPIATILTRSTRSASHPTRITPIVLTAPRIPAMPMTDRTSMSKSRAISGSAAPKVKLSKD